jgi:hypothetical protein
MLGKVVDMKTTPTAAPRRRNPASSLLRALRGDKHMVGAYPPPRDGPEPSTAAHDAPADVRPNAGSAVGTEAS